MTDRDRRGPLDGIASQRTHARRPLASKALSAIALIAALTVPATAAAADSSTPQSSLAGLGATRGEYSINLYEKGDFASQRT